MPDHQGPVVMAAGDPEALDSASLALAAGGIVGLPTETVYGLAVLPRDEALQALIRAKQRAHDKGVALLVNGADQVEALVITSRPARLLADRFWPGPLTLVLPLRPDVWVPDALNGGRDTLALRLPDHAVPRALARRLGPLAVSSANVSGEPEAGTAQALLRSVGASLALVLDDGPVRGGVASTVVAVDAHGAARILREGAIERQAIEAVIEVG